MRETDIELRDLARKLRAAYVNKDLAAQLEEKKLAELYQKVCLLIYNFLLFWTFFSIKIMFLPPN